MKKPKKVITKKAAPATSNKIYKRNPQVLFRETAEGAISLLRMSDMENYFTVDAWAAQLWMLIDGKKNTAQIFQALEKKSGLDPKFVQAEAKKCIKLLEKFDLIE